MALRTYVSAGVYDTHVGTGTVTTTSQNITAAGVTSPGFTAPNLVNASTGAWIYISAIPTTINVIVELQESTVTKASATMNNADIKLGWNYARFTTPYTFATLTASAYRIKVYSSGGTSGTVLGSTTTTLLTTTTYNTASALAANDDVWVGGFHNSGLTAKQLVFSGAVATVVGSGTDKTMQDGTVVTMGAAITVGTGGGVSADTTVSTSLTVRGSIICSGTGSFTWSGNVSDKTKVSTLTIDCNTTNGEFGIFTTGSNRGGQLTFTGADYIVSTKYASGVGTAANPLIVSTAWDADVGDEIVIGTSTAYNQNEVRYIKTRNSSTSFVLSSTPGGAEAALTYTHATGVHIANLTRNCVVKPLTTSRGYKVYSQSTLLASDFGLTRWEYSSAASAHGLNFKNLAASVDTMDKAVLYQNSAGTRNTLNINNCTTAATITDVVAYNNLCTNTSNAAIGTLTCSGQTFENCLDFGGAGTAVSGTSFSTRVNSSNITFNNCHSYGANGSNTAAISAIYVSGSNNITFTNCTVNAARTNGVYFSSGVQVLFNNCNFGNFFTNVIDVLTLTTTYNTALFKDCTFGSATLISGYLNQLDGSDIAFQDFGTNTSSHRWYSNKGSFWSSGAGLTDTTVRTAGSLAVAIKPENNTLGATMTFKVPANPTSQVQVYGYLYRNATFSSGTLKVDLFLPDTLLTAAPDDTVTLATTTGAWLPWTLTANYTSTDSRYATVVVTAVTSTAGAYAFLDDIYDAGLTNKVAGLDLWDNGHISPIIVAADYSSIPDQSRVAVWSDTDTYTTGQKGLVLQDAADDAELAAIK